MEKIMTQNQCTLEITIIWNNIVIGLRVII